MNTLTRYLIVFFITGIVILSITLIFNISWILGSAAFLLVFVLFIAYWDRMVDKVQKWIYKPSARSTSVVKVVKEEDTGFEAEYNPFDFKTTPRAEGNAAIDLQESADEYIVDYSRNVNESRDTIVQNFIQHFDIDLSVARSLVDAGYRSMGDFDDVQITDLLDVESVDREIAHRILDRIRSSSEDV